MESSDPSSNSMLRSSSLSNNRNPGREVVFSSIPSVTGSQGLHTQTSVSLSSSRNPLSFVPSGSPSRPSSALTSSCIVPNPSSSSESSATPSEASPLVTPSSSLSYTQQGTTSSDSGSVYQVGPTNSFAHAEEIPTSLRSPTNTNPGNFTRPSFLEADVRLLILKKINAIEKMQMADEHRGGSDMILPEESVQAALDEVAETYYYNSGSATRIRLALRASCLLRNQPVVFEAFLVTVDRSGTPTWIEMLVKDVVFADQPRKFTFDPPQWDGDSMVGNFMVKVLFASTENPSPKTRVRSFLLPLSSIQRPIVSPLGPPSRPQFGYYQREDEMFAMRNPRVIEYQSPYPSPRRQPYPFSYTSSASREMYPSSPASMIPYPRNHASFSSDFVRLPFESSVPIIESSYNPLPSPSVAVFSIPEKPIEKKMREIVNSTSKSSSLPTDSFESDSHFSQPVAEPTVVTRADGIVEKRNYFFDMKTLRSHDWRPFNLRLWTTCVWMIRFRETLDPLLLAAVEKDSRSVRATLVLEHAGRAIVDGIRVTQHRLSVCHKEYIEGIFAFTFDFDKGSHKFLANLNVEILIDSPTGPSRIWRILQSPSFAILKRRPVLEEMKVYRMRNRLHSSGDKDSLGDLEDSSSQRSVEKRAAEDDTFSSRKRRKCDDDDHSCRESGSASSSLDALLCAVDVLQDDEPRVADQDEGLLSSEAVKIESPLSMKSKASNTFSIASACIEEA